MKLTVKKVVCDRCGTLVRSTFPDTRLTKCCSTYDKDSKLAFYKTKDDDGKTVYYGKTVYSCGKAVTKKLRFPLTFYWRGFWK